MAEMNLRRHELEDGELPLVCAKCGEEATEWREKTFTWSPGWTLLLAIVSLAIGLLVVLRVQISMNAQIPFCDRHRNYFRSRVRLLAFTFLAIFLLFAVGIGIMVSDPTRQRVAGPFVALSLFGLIGWVILAIVVSKTAIRATSMTQSDAVLVGLNTAFVKAVIEHRRAKRGDSPVFGEEIDYDRKLRERRFERLQRNREQED